MDDLYHEALLEEAENPFGREVMPNPSVQATVRHASCGDEVTIFGKVDAKTGRITQVTWVGQGCVVSQVGMSTVTKALAAQLPISPPSFAMEQSSIPDYVAMLDLLHLDSLSPGRVKCILLGTQAWKELLKKMQGAE